SKSSATVVCQPTGMPASARRRLSHWLLVSRFWPLVSSLPMDRISAFTGGSWGCGGRSGDAGIVCRQAHPGRCASLYTDGEPPRPGPAGGGARPPRRREPVGESPSRSAGPRSRCGYLPDRLWSLEYELFAALAPAEYEQRMHEGWRRFGAALFRPRCPACTACRPLRVLVDRFRPDRSQRRVRKANEGVVEGRVGRPAVTRGKLGQDGRLP